MTYKVINGIAKSITLQESSKMGFTGIRNNVNYNKRKVKRGKTYVVRKICD